VVECTPSASFPVLQGTMKSKRSLKEIVETFSSKGKEQSGVLGTMVAKTYKMYTVNRTTSKVCTYPHAFKRSKNTGF